MQRTLIYGAVVAAIAVAGLAWWPLPYRHVLSLGTDSYETHRPVAGERTAMQELTTSRRTVGVGVLAVNLRRAESLAPLHVVVSGTDGTVLANAVITPDPAVDDELSWALFSSGAIPAHTPVRITISAPEATGSNAYGIRFDGDDKQLAIGMLESIPAWRHVALWQDYQPQLADLVATMLAIGAVGGALASSDTVARALERRKIFALALCVLAIVTIALRVPTAVAIDSIFGGDAFNYFLKSRALVEGRDPFAADPRKAPLLSLLALPGLAIIDPRMMGRIIGMVSAAAGVVLVPLIGRRLGLTPLSALLGGALLMVNRMWWWESVHGLANIPYAALLLGASFAFLVGTPYALGVLASLATLMRFEGALAVATLLPALWIRLRTWRAVWRSVLPVMILITIPLLLWPFSGVSGIRTPSDIAADPGLYIAWDIPDYVNNLQRFRIFIGRLWLLEEFVGNQLAAFVGGIVVGLVLAFKRALPRIATHLLAATPYVAGVVILGLAAYGNHDLLKLVMLGLTAITGAGCAYLAMRSPRLTGVYVMLTVQVAFVTLILPKDRYYTTIIPWAALGIISGIAAAGSTTRWHRMGAGLLCGLVIGLAYSTTTYALPGLISDYNEKSGAATAMSNTAAYVRHHPGQVAAPDYAFLFIHTYLPSDRFILLEPESKDTAAELARLRAADITYVLSFEDEENLASITAYPDQFSIEAQLDGATVYRLRSVE